MNAPDNRHQNEECGGVENRHAVILYPAGGAFNKLRPQQRYLEDLLEQHWRAYSLTPPSQKRSFVKEHFIDPMKASGRTFQIFKGRSPDQGRLVTLTEDDSMERLSQKLRDAKKRCLVCKPKKRAKATTRTTTLKSRGGAAKASGKLKPSATKAKTNSSKNHGGKASVAKHRVAAPAPIRDWDETPNPVETRYGLDTNDDDDDDIIAIFRDVNKQLPTQEEKEGVDDDDTNNNWDHEGAAWGRVLDQLKNWRQLSTNQRATIEKLQLITAHQHKMLVDHGIVVSDPSDNRYNENSSNYNINFMYYHHQLQQQLPHDLVGV